MNEREDIVEHIISNGCEILSDRSPKHSIYVNTGDKSLKSALLKNNQLTDKYVINVCKCLGISIPVLIDIRNQN